VRANSPEALALWRSLIAQLVRRRSLQDDPIRRSGSRRANSPEALALTRSLIAQLVRRRSLQDDPIRRSGVPCARTALKRSRSRAR
jgi:hypothetical protein